MKKYIFLEVIIPVLFIGIIYAPGGSFQLKDESHLLYKVFATGDLLPICLLIVINAYVKFERANDKLLEEIIKLPTEPERRAAAEQHAGNWIWRLILGFGGAGLFLLYYDIKVSAIPYQFPADNVPVSEDIINYMYFGFGALVVVAILGPIFHWLASTDEDSD
ncbi:hypothetical protein G5S35_08090 [Paraburkholderia tropica]|uniref:hypothetical protein n=1 Tax=Paraburkholderia tropica TaxID=92647 RepID=UPI0016020301|nr:hypothetical protein [Paraburkholderia tropica]QNB11542.1 hypothetical protein G5S35_08090 [Paraburkholderia tropica]